MELLTELLRSVSRSFYLTLRVLPGPIRPQVSLAYLLARTTDTIADTETLPVERRLETLRTFREHITGGQRSTAALKQLVPDHQPSTAEHALLLRIDEMLELLNSFSQDDQRLIRDVIATITSGQELDLQRFGPSRSAGSSSAVTALESDEQLDDYTWRVAGCVGEFWTKICRRHLFPNHSVPEPALIEKGIRFGKGLQLVNILRDIPADLRKGRCYLPAKALMTAGLKPENLLDPSSEARLRPVYDAYLNLAEAHLRSGWEYTNLLPKSQRRVRLACAWPITIGMQTLRKLRTQPVLGPAHPIKITRGEVKRIIATSVFGLLWPPAWQRLFPSK